MPVASLQLHTGRFDAIFGDQRVEDSVLTAGAVVVRGFHFDWNNWNLQLDYVSTMAYQNVLLSADPEYVYGVSRRFRLSKNAVVPSTYTTSTIPRVNRRLRTMVPSQPLRMSTSVGSRWN